MKTTLYIALLLTANTCAGQSLAIFTTGRLYLMDATQVALAEENIQRLPVVYIRITDKLLAPAFYSYEEKIIYQWSGIQLSINSFHHSADGTPGGGQTPQVWDPVDNKFDLEDKKVAMLRKEFTILKIQPRYVYFKPASVGYYVRGCYDVKHSLFFRTDDVQYSMSQISQADIVQNAYPETKYDNWQYQAIINVVK